MKKSTFIKRFIALLLVVLMSINTFAAVVGDNDGAAFITKAEFDSMKNDFQSQLDRYNSSIDNKIDGTIAAYLSGISVKKTTELRPLINNYSDIKWVRNFKLYGKQRRWINNTTKSESSNNEWYQPNLNEKRLPLRDNSNTITFLDNLNYQDGWLVLIVDVSATQCDNGVYFGERNYNAYNAAPVNFIELNKDSDGLFYPASDPLRALTCIFNTQMIKPHILTESGYNFYINRNAAVCINSDLTDPIEVLATTAGKLYDLRIKYKSSYYYDHTDTIVRTAPSFSDCMFPGVWSSRTVFDATPISGGSTAVVSGTEGITTNFFDKGVTVNVGDTASKTSQINLFNDMMIGADFDLQMNAGYVSESNIANVTYDFSTSTDTGYIRGNISKANLSSPPLTDKATDPPHTAAYYPSSNLPITLSIPMFPTINLSSINSKKFRYADKPLQLGQGIPLATNIISNGVLVISATYNTNRIISSYTNTGITIDIADKSFDKSNINYFQGYLGNVDVDTTSEPLVTFNNFAINNTDKKLLLTIPVKSGDSLWLRMAPQDGSGGYYATLSDLSMSLIVN